MPSSPSLFRILIPPIFVLVLDFEFMNFQNFLGLSLQLFATALCCSLSNASDSFLTKFLTVLYFCSTDGSLVSRYLVHSLCFFLFIFSSHLILDVSKLLFSPVIAI